MKRLAIIVLGLIATPVVAPAETEIAHFVSGNELLQSCTSGEMTDQLLCTGYLQGAADMLNAVRTSLGDENCVKPPIIEQQLQAVVVKYLSQYPGSRPISAGQVSFTALVQAFCLPHQPPKADNPSVNYR
jgi:hypothetical protein